MKRVKRYIILFIINNFLSCTRFFKIKRYLLSLADIKIGKNTKVVGPIKFGSQINIKIGDNCWIGKDLNLDGNGEVIIGDNIDIAPYVVINTGGHKIGDRKRRAGDCIVNNITIESGTWIGTRATILNNIKIGESSVIAAGSIVIRDVDKNSLMAGNPAKIKRVLE